ncbi:hypothetical protein T05_7682 [Trichinella murrelli]|uniref:Uncharacterized protein n=1 Tax=Trichinella murrelli TaxID=144512 RepID=A0A0V0TFN7_9BILA|nr:hypothetical protein T05_7682 [Trichinella murrelli]
MPSGKKSQLQPTSASPSGEVASKKLSSSSVVLVVPEPTPTLTTQTARHFSLPECSLLGQLEAGENVALLSAMSGTRHIGDVEGIEAVQPVEKANEGLIFTHLLKLYWLCACKLLAELSYYGGFASNSLPKIADNLLFKLAAFLVCFLCLLVLFTAIQCRSGDEQAVRCSVFGIDNSNSNENSIVV